MKFLIIVIVGLSVMFVVGAKMGIIDVPGLSPAQKKATAAKTYASDADKLATKNDGSATKTEAGKEGKNVDAEAKTEVKADPNAATPVDDKTAGAGTDEKTAANSNPVSAPKIAEAAPSQKSESVAQKTPQIAASDDPKSTTPSTAKAAQKTVLVTVDPLAGQKQLADIWKKMESDTPVKIIADWKDEEVAKQLSVMSPKQVGEILGLMKPDRASKLSKQLQLMAQAEAKKVAETAGRKA